MSTCLASINVIQNLTVFFFLYVNNRSVFLFAFFKSLWKESLVTRKYIPNCLGSFPSKLCGFCSCLLSLKFTVIFDVRITGGRNPYLERK